MGGVDPLICPILHFDIQSARNRAVRRFQSFAFVRGVLRLGLPSRIKACRKKMPISISLLLNQLRLSSSAHCLRCSATKVPVYKSVYMGTSFGSIPEIQKFVESIIC